MKNKTRVIKLISSVKIMITKYWAIIKIVAKNMKGFYMKGLLEAYNNDPKNQSVLTHLIPKSECGKMRTRITPNMDTF